MKTLLTILSIALLATLAGCAGILTGSKEIVQVSSNVAKPLKAKLTVGDEVKDITLPAIVEVKRTNAPIIVQIVDACYQGQAISGYKAHSVVLANLFFSYSSSFSTSTDYSTGAYWRYDENINIPTYAKENCK